jgi:2',3'-cyclic-nucleotide 2'-phosphodiesterase (5'-nucleotidase family)
MERTYLTYVLIFSLMVSCTMSYEVVSMKGSGQKIAADEIIDDEKMESIISPYRIQLEEEMSTVLCESMKPMVRARPESELGNFMSDLCLQRARTIAERSIDCALFNYGAIRTALPQGNITRGKIFELMPFENELVIVDLPLSAMQDMMDYLAFTGGEPLSEIELTINGEKVVSAFVGGEELSEKTYRVLTSDYLAGGGDNMNFLTQDQRIGIEKLGLKIRDAILDHCIDLGESGEQINSQLDGRISIQE